MERLKEIFIRVLFIGLGFCLIIVVITSTTGFKIQKNPMENFFMQHESIDLANINDSISRQKVLEDIDYLVNTIEDVHPEPYFSISKDRFYFLVDSIKKLVPDEIIREDLYNLLKPLIGALKDGHTSINFPETSSSQDNKSNYENEHTDSVLILNYKSIAKSIGYIKFIDFVMDKTKFNYQLNEIFEQVHNDFITDLIIDIRNNPGGNSELTDILTNYIYNKPYKTNSKIIVKRSEQYYSYTKGYFSWWFRPFLRFIKQIEDYRKTPIGENYEEVKGAKSIIKPEYQFNGNKYLLINSNTFSTALIFAAAFKDNKMGTIIGERTKAEVNGFGDIYPFDLPNSRLWVWCSTKMFIRPSGEMTRGGLQPDIFIADEGKRIIEFAIDFIENRE